MNQNKWCIPALDTSTTSTNYVYRDEHVMEENAQHPLKENWIVHILFLEADFSPFPSPAVMIEVVILL